MTIAVMTVTGMMAIVTVTRVMLKMTAIVVVTLTWMRLEMANHFLNSRGQGNNPYRATPAAPAE